MTIWSFIAMLAAAQGIFLALALLIKSRSKKNRSFLILGALVLIFSLWLLEFAAYWSPFLLRWPHLAFLTKALPWLFGPLLYLFTLTHYSSDHKSNRWFFLHFTPALAKQISLLPLIFSSKSEKVSVLNRIIYSNPPEYSPIYLSIEFLNLAQLSLYIWLTYRLIQKNKIDNKLVVRWVFLGILFFTVSFAVHLTNILVLDYDFIAQVGSVILVLGSVLIYLLAFLIVIKPEVIAQIGAKSIPQIKYVNSGLKEQKATAYEQMLIKELQEKKIYRDSSLTLKRMANELNIPSYQLSQLLNEHMNTSFNELINSYRINDVKERLCNPQFDNLTIMGIAQDAGFNTRATFYKVFKSHFRTTPSEYRRQAILNDPN